MRRYLWIIGLLVCQQAIAQQEPLELVVPIGHTDRVNELALTTDGRFLVSASDDNTLKLWDVRSGMEVLTYRGHRTSVTTFCLSPDNKRLFSAARDGQIIVWDLQTAAIHRSFLGDPGGVDHLATDSSGTRLLCTYKSGKLVLLDLKTGKNVSEHSAKITAAPAFFLPGNEQVLYLDYGSLAIWNSSLPDKHHFNDELNISYKLAGDNTRSVDMGSRLFFTAYDREKNIVHLHTQSNDTLTLLRVDVAKLSVLQRKSFPEMALQKATLLPGRNELILFITPAGKENRQNTVLHLGSDDLSERKRIDVSSAIERVCAITANGNRLVAVSDNKIQWWDVKNNAVALEMKGYSVPVENLSLTRDALITNGLAWNAKNILDVKPAAKGTAAGREPAGSREQQQRKMETWDLSSTLAISTPDRQLTATALTNKSIQVKAKDGKELFTLWGHTDQISSLCFSPGNKYLLSGGYSLDNRILLWDLATGTLAKEFTGHTGAVNKLVFNDDGKHFYSSSFDNTIVLWDMEKEQRILTLVLLGHSEWMAITPGNYYACSRNAARYVGFRVGTQVFPFEQFDLKYNRPDRVYAAWPGKSSELQELYYKAWQKRLKKMNFSEDMLSGSAAVPLLKVLNEDAIPMNTLADSIALAIGSNKHSALLDRINVWVNNTPVLGSDGIDLRSRKTDSVSERLAVRLSAGVNKIQVSVLDQLGIESLKQTFLVRKETPAPKTTLHIISIGASAYADSRWNLKYAAKDANDFAAAFDQQKAGYSQVQVTSLLNKDISPAGVARLRERLLNSSVDDIVMIFYAGHGLLSKQLDYYLSTYGMDFSAPENGGIPYDQLEKLVDGIPARKRMIIIDACHSGEVDKEEGLKKKSVITADGKLSARGVIVEDYRPPANVSTTNAFELMRQLFSDLRRGTGAIVISSAGGAEFALEGDTWNNGVFTYALLQGLKNGEADLDRDGAVLTSELQSYLAERVRKLTNNLQNPTSRQENVEMDFPVWYTNWK